MKTLFMEEDNKFTRVGLYDLCEWFIETYPNDIFIIEPKEIVAIRENMEKLLKVKSLIKKEKNQ